MTVKHRLRADQLQVGAPLPVDIFDAENRLLLRRGNVIATASQLERLIDSGLFTSQPIQARTDTAPAEKRPRPAGGDDPFVDGPVVRARATPVPKAAQRISVYSEMVQASTALGSLLRAPEEKKDFIGAISAMTDTLCRGCLLDADAALAHIQFAIDACYPARQAINTAIVTALLLERMKNDPERTHAAVCAALTMNCSIYELQTLLYQQQSLGSEYNTALTHHPITSAKKLAELGVTDPLWLALVEQHHEFIDGSGYPKKLTGSAVALEAQVIGLADRYCGAVTERAYRAPIAPGIALKQIHEKSGDAIDPKLIAGLVYWVGIYPPGTVVELFNHDIAIVSRRLQDLKNPMVYAVAGETHQPFEVPRRRATATQPQFRIERVLPRDTIKFPVDPEVLWPRTAVNDVATQG